MWWNRSKRQILILVLLAAVLAGAFWLGGNAPGSRGERRVRTSHALED